MRKAAITKSLISVLLLMFVMACVQKGPLVPPPDKPNTNQQPQKKPETQKEKTK